MAAVDEGCDLLSPPLLCSYYSPAGLCSDNSRIAAEMTLALVRNPEHSANCKPAGQTRPLLWAFARKPMTLPPCHQQNGQEGAGLICGPNDVSGTWLGLTATTTPGQAYHRH